MLMEKLIFIIVMVFALYLSINVVQNFTIKFDLLSQILDEFDIGYVEDIAVFNSTECPKNYEGIVKNFNWPGNYKGCGCRNKNYKDNKPEDENNNKFNFNYGDCPSKENCYPIEETFRVNMNKWRENIICLKRSKDSYLKYNISSNLNNSKNILPCSNSTHKNCGIIDGSLNYLCLKRNKECPINDIKIINKNDLGDYEIENNEIKKNSSIITIKNINNPNNIYHNYSLINLSENFVLIYSKEEIKINPLENNSNLTNNNKIIPINFRAEIGNEVCLNNFKYPKSSLFFPLTKNRFNYQCDLYPNNTEIFDENLNKNIIDSYNLETFLEENNYLIQIKDIITPFEIDYSN